MEMMRDELAHKRKLEFASAQAATMVPAPFKPMSCMKMHLHVLTFITLITHAQYVQGKAF